MSEGPYDYAREIDDARNHDGWRYPRPGQWVDGEWRTYDNDDAKELT